MYSILKPGRILNSDGCKPIEKALPYGESFVSLNRFAAAVARGCQPVGFVVINKQEDAAERPGNGVNPVHHGNALVDGVATVIMATRTTHQNDSIEIMGMTARPAPRMTAARQCESASRQKNSEQVRIFCTPKAIATGSWVKALMRMGPASTAARQPPPR